MQLVGCSETAGNGGSGGAAGGSAGGGGMGGDGGSGGMGGDEFMAGESVTVSGLSPFAECDADFDPEQTYWLDSEVEPWIAVDPTNPDHIATAWQQDRYSNGGCRGNVAGTSFDGGATWETVVIPGLTRCSGGQWLRTTDPWLSFGANGDLYSASLLFDEVGAASSVVVNRSADGGLTWSDPITVDEVDAPFWNDKESITADPEDACTLYATWTRANDLSVDLSGVTLVSRTTDCGETWGEPRVITETEIVGVGLQIVVMPDRSLRAFSAPGTGGGELTVQQSTDQGDTWAEPVPVANIRRNRPFTTDQSARIRSGDLLFDVGADRDSGHLYVVWEQLFVAGMFPVQVAFSSSNDGGLTWSTPIRIDQTPTSESPSIEQAFLPSVEVSDEGIIGVTYYNFQNAMVGSPTSMTDHWFVHCNPADADCTGEASWAGSELRLTRESFDYLLAPGADPLFLGDYLGLAAAGNDFFAFFSATAADDPANAIFVPIRGR